MRHRVKGKRLNRSTKHRQAMYKNLISALVEKGEIETTLAKAKAIKGLVDKLIATAKKGSLHHRRQLAAFFGKRKPANKLVEEVAPRLGDRTSGYTRIVRLGHRRGDSAMMAKLELVSQSKEKPKEVTEKDKEKIEKKKKLQAGAGKDLAAKRIPKKPVDEAEPEMQGQAVTSSRAAIQKRGER